MRCLFKSRLIRYRPLCDNPPISVERLKPTVAELERRGVTFTQSYGQKLVTA